VIPLRCRRGGDDHVADAGRAGRASIRPSGVDGRPGGSDGAEHERVTVRILGMDGDSTARWELGLTRSRPRGVPSFTTWTTCATDGTPPRANNIQ
jgi:hypothetical protein